MYFLLLATASLMMITLRRGMGIFFVSTAITVLFAFLLDDLDPTPQIEYSSAFLNESSVRTSSAPEVEANQDMHPQMKKKDESEVDTRHEDAMDSFVINKEKTLLPRNVNVPAQDYTKRAMGFANDQMNQIAKRRNENMSRVSKSDRYYKPILQPVEEKSEE